MLGILLQPYKDQWTQAHCMKVNGGRTRKLRINRKEYHEAAKIGNKVIEDVNEFNDLGSIVTRDGSLTAEIDRRLCKASSAVFRLSFWKMQI